MLGIRRVFYFVLITTILALQILSAPQPVSAQAAQPVEMSGWFSIIWGDGAPGSGASTDPVYMLTAEGGQATRLLMDATQAAPAGGVLALDRQKVILQGLPETSATGTVPQNMVRVISIELDPTQHVAATSVNGSQPFVSIMCKFSDYDAEPKNLTYFKGMYASTAPGLDHYWREVSYNTTNVSGSSAVGWFNLPHPRQYYFDSDALNFDRITNDCTALADPTVNFASLVGINMMFNADLDGFAWGGGHYMTLDGVTRVWPMTWEPPWGYIAITVMSHEMGHAFGLPHSSGAYGETYDNQWDVMSDNWSNCERSTDPVFGCEGQHTIAYHKDRLGWIPASQKLILAGNTAASVTLEQLALPQTSNYKMIQIPIRGSSSHFYTLEVRRQTGYDIKLPGQAVIIHEVDLSRERPAYVIDPDLNGDTGDAGAMWTTGEVFRDTANGISVAILSETATGFQVTVQNGTLSISGNTGLGGVSLRYSDGVVKTVTSASNGAYSLPVSYGWSGEVTPVKVGYSFSPANHAYTNITSSKTGQNFSALVSISGSAGVAGATLKYVDGVAKTVLANASGIYTIKVPYNWSGRVTPVKAGVTSFTPAFRNYLSLKTSQSGQNYHVNRQLNLVSIAVQDGYLRESSETSGLGGGLNASSVVLVVGDSALKQQYRGLLSFNTSVLPDTAVIISARLKLKLQAMAGTNPAIDHGYIVMDLRQPYFGKTSALGLDDFAATASLDSAGWLGKTPVADIYTGIFSTASFPRFNRLGLTQMRLRFQLGNDNDNIADYLAFYSGDAATGAYKPLLEIVYYIP